MTALALLKAQIKNARETFEGTAADILTDHVHKDPGGKAFPLGALYAHLIFSEDVIIQGMLQGKAPLSETSYKGKTGTSEPMPAMDAHWSENNEKWSKTVQVDLQELRAYAQAVYAATDAYVESITDTDLDTLIDLGDWGKKTVAELLYSFVIAHTNSLAGELSAIKGVHGVKGYQF